MKIKVQKIKLLDFMDALKGIYESGADYVDIVGMADEFQDTLVVEVRDEYMAPPEEGNDITDELLNDLI